MSTCPNNDLLSAYIDDELPSPWREKLERHLCDCSVCRDVYGRYAAIHRRIQAVSNEHTLDTAASFARLLEKRNLALELKQKAQNKRWGVATGENWFFSSIRVPVPAVAAAVLLFVLMPLMLFFQMEHTVNSAAAQSSFTPILPVPLEKQISEIDYGISHTHKSDSRDYVLSAKAVNTGVKLFTVGEFARLYSANDDMFQPVHSAVDLKISSSLFPLMAEYQMLYSAADIGSNIGNQ